MVAMRPLSRCVMAPVSVASWAKAPCVPALWQPRMNAIPPVAAPMHCAMPWPVVSLPMSFSPSQMYNVMDLCLGCKACKSECPSAVDMAKIKAEYLVHYYQHNGLPLFNRLMGLLPTLNPLLYRLARPLIPLINWGIKTFPARANHGTDRCASGALFAPLCRGNIRDVVPETVTRSSHRPSSSL